MKFKNILYKKDKKIYDLLVRKVKLDILGISYTKNEDDKIIYVVILGDGDTDRKIPVIVDYYEAQAIAIEVEKISPIVPLVYDVLRSMINDHKMKFNEILISDYKKDILITHLVGPKEKFEIRTADALALSIRMNYPIFIYENVLSNVNEVVQKYYDIRKAGQMDSDKDRLERFTISELSNLLQKAINEEEYEKASEIRDEINKKKMKK